MYRYLSVIIMIFLFFSCNEPDGKMDRKLLEWTSDYEDFDFSKKKQKAIINIPQEGGKFLFVCTNGDCLGFEYFKLQNFPNYISYNDRDSVFCEDCFSANFVDKGGIYGGTKFTITFEKNSSDLERILRFEVSPSTTGAYTEFEFMQQAKSN